MNKERPILFSTPMVQAILEGRKTQTRRIVRYNITLESDMPPKGLLENFAVYDKKGVQYWLDGEDCPATLANGFCPYGSSGDILWVRETWNITRGWGENISGEAINSVNGTDYVYKATTPFRKNPDHPEFGDLVWKPSIHMPKAACRLFLKITDIRVERLWDITELDAFAEGIDDEGDSYIEAECAQSAGVPVSAGSPAQHSFANLWIRINGPDSWDANPWVWVIEFDKIDKP